MREPIFPHNRRLLGRIPRGCRVAGCLILIVPCSIVGVFLLFISLISPPASAPITPALPADFLKGITYESWWSGEFSSANSDQTLSDIVQPMGADWIALIVKCHQATLTSTEISCTDPSTA